MHELRFKARSEVAATALGHSSAKLTDEVYAERDMQRVAEVLKRVG